VIFDLDGTLIDSAAGILRALEGALAGAGLPPRVPLTSALIGPPLRQVLAALAGTEDADVMARLAGDFRAQYDAAGCLEARPFPGVEAMLDGLVAAGIPLMVATNKRAVPTQRIMAHLGWDRRFVRVVSLDGVSPPVGAKAALLAHLVREQGLRPGRCLYVGDRVEDWQAARACGLPFAGAAWGYGAGGAGGAGALEASDAVPWLSHPDGGRLLALLRLPSAPVGPVTAV
jgi:phosphoglycolate phosphatase